MNRGFACLIVLPLLLLSSCQNESSSNSSISDSSSSESAVIVSSYEESSSSSSIDVSKAKMEIWISDSMNVEAPSIDKLNISTCYYLFLRFQPRVAYEDFSLVYDQEAITVSFATADYDEFPRDRLNYYYFALYTNEAVGDFSISVKENPAKFDFSISDLSVSYTRMGSRSPSSVPYSCLELGSRIIDSVETYEECSLALKDIMTYHPTFEASEEYFSRFIWVYYQFAYDKSDEEFVSLDGVYLVNDTLFLSISIDVYTNIDPYWDYANKAYLIKLDASIAFSKVSVKYNSYFKEQA